MRPSTAIDGALGLSHIGRHAPERLGIKGGALLTVRLGSRREPSDALVMRRAKPCRPPLHIPIQSNCRRLPSRRLPTVRAGRRFHGLAESLSANGLSSHYITLLAYV